MLAGAEQSGLLLKEGSLQKGDRKASLVVENRQYSLTADAVAQAALLSEYLMPEGVTSVDILLEEEGFNGPTVNYTLQREAAAIGSKYVTAKVDPIKLVSHGFCLNPPTLRIMSCRLWLLA